MSWNEQILFFQHFLLKFSLINTYLQTADLCEDFHLTFSIADNMSKTVQNYWTMT